ncbi:unnamed protein product [Cuscuta europaea]|uniref:Uncharacterized protein n=1 Tax=Cuscuta europaea TaxID=41803 RepID=A0A9P0ZR92_CUSEU|nr:unnamed protein product [Cuscuta europaea]
MEYYNSEKEIRKCSLERNTTRQNEKEKSRHQKQTTKHYAAKQNQDENGSAKQKQEENKSAKQNQEETDLPNKTKKNCYRRKEEEKRKRGGEEEKERICKIFARASRQTAAPPDSRTTRRPHSRIAKLSDRCNATSFSICLATSTTPV